MRAFRTPMRWWIWLSFAGSLGAEDPFASHEASIRQRLNAMLAVETRPAPAPQTIQQPAADPLRDIIEPILLAEGLPRELIAVVQVESAGRPFALSPKGARGLWQFMPETARRYGLTVAGQADDRVHVVRSTRAAARYLKDLYNRFGNWPLALAAYNAGEEAVARAVVRAGSAEFSAIARLLPAETRNYVPAVLAALREVVRKLRQSGLAAGLPLSASKEAE